MSILANNRNVSRLIFTLVLGMIVLMCAGNTAATDENMRQDLFVLGNKAYVKGNYDQAIVRYKAALDKEGYSSSLLYNLGNAYFMKNEFGQSILNYERALYLDPGNTQIKTNLALARKKSGLAIQEPTSWKYVFKRLTLDQWTWVGMITLCAFSMISLLNGILPGIFRRRVLKITVCICFLLIMAAGTGMVLQHGTLNRGVIVGENARLRVSPFDSAAKSDLIKSGKVVHLAKTYEGYIFIEEDNGQSGWIPEDAVEAILPKTDQHGTHTPLTQSTIGTIGGNGQESVMDKT